MNTYNFSELLTTWSTIRKCEFLSQKHLEYSSFVTKVLVQFEQFVMLRKFVSGLTCEEFALLRGNECFLKALVKLDVYEGNFREALMTIKNGTFREPSELFDVWNKCHYRLKENETRNRMSVLGRLRIRKRFPPPPSICPDGVITPRFQQRPHQLFRWIQNHRPWWYPDTQELDTIPRAMSLSIINVRNSLQKVKTNLQRKQQKVARKKCVKGTKSINQEDRDGFTIETSEWRATNEPCVSKIDLVVSIKLSDKAAMDGLLQCNSPSAQSCQPHGFNNSILIFDEDVEHDISGVGLLNRKPEYRIPVFNVKTSFQT